MGTFGGYSSKDEIKTEILNSFASQDVEVLGTASTKFGSNWWVAVRTPSGKSGIALYKLSSHRGDYAYKPIEESMGPVEKDCPLRLLDMTEGFGSYGTEWRQAVRAFHAAKAAHKKATFEPNDKVLVYGKPYEVVGKTKRSFIIKSLDTGAVYKCGASKMIKA